MAAPGWQLSSQPDKKKADSRDESLDSPPLPRLLPRPRLPRFPRSRVTFRGDDAGFTFERRFSRRDSHLQAAAVVDGGLQGYPGDKDPVVPVDAIALAYVEAEGLSRSFDYLDEVNGVLGILKQRSRVRAARELS